MKILENKYPIGSINNRTPGRYVDGTLYSNFEILAKNIVRDMTFLLFVFSSTLEVGTGKTVVTSQMGELWTYLVNKIHGLNIPFDMKNCVFKPRDLIDRSFKVPKYSFIWLDEWEDTHYWSELGMSLRQFFRKCRQLNLCIICIIPNFFQLPLSYAVSRSVAAVDVKFAGEFERGYFSFYNFEAKKDLYIKGKKFHDYKVVQPTFSGRFVDGYAVPEAEYRKAKYLDMINSEKGMEVPTEKEVKVKLFRQLHSNLTEISIKRLSEGFGVSLRTGQRWLSKNISTSEAESRDDSDTMPSITTILTEPKEISPQEVQEVQDNEQQ